MGRTAITAGWPVSGSGAIPAHLRASAGILHNEHCGRLGSPAPFMESRVSREAELDVVIVGAGLAGLACATELQRAGRRVRVYEAGDQVGGRVRTDEVDGYRLDRGFQVYLTAYPEGQRLLDYGALDLRAYPAGARVRTPTGFALVGDPLRDPLALPATLMAPVGSLADKLRILRWRIRTGGGDAARLLEGDDVTTAQMLEQAGFSRTMRERFFTPFLGGVFLDSELSTSRRMADYVWRMFSTGSAAIPARGMQEIPRQLARRLSTGTVVTGSPVADVRARGVRLQSGEWVEANHVVVATDMDQAARLVAGVAVRSWRSTTCLWFAADAPPATSAHLMLNGTGTGRVNTVTVPTLLTDGLAPAGKHLVCVSLVGESELADDTLQAAIRDELRGWFGDVVDGWRGLAVQRITNALPSQNVGDLEPPSRAVHAGDGLWICGDHVEQSSIQGALLSGSRVARAILAA